MLKKKNKKIKVSKCILIWCALLLITVMLVYIYRYKVMAILIWVLSGSNNGALDIRNDLTFPGIITATCAYL
jgi:hypothetical protein